MSLLLVSGLVISYIIATLYTATQSPILTPVLPALILMIAAYYVWERLPPVNRMGWTLALLALFAFGMIYALNPSHVWVQGVGLWPEDAIAALPSSVSATESWFALGLFMGAIGWFTLGAVLQSHERRWLQWFWLLVAFVSAAIVIHDRVLPRQYPIYEFTGWFTYRNHFAAFANLLVPVMLAGGCRQQFNAHRNGAASNPAGLFYLAALMLAVAIVLSGSRMGIALCGASMTAWGIGYVVLRHRYDYLYPVSRTFRPILVVGVLLVFGLVAFTAWWAQTGFQWPRLGELGFRGLMINEALTIWRDNPVWGVGAGTFGLVRPYYQSDALAAHGVLHVHCEPIQLLAEWGTLGTLLVAVLCGFVGWTLFRSTDRLSGSRPRYSELESVAFLVGVLTVLVHSLVDFPFRAPLILWTTALWLGLMRPR